MVIAKAFRAIFTLLLLLLFCLHVGVETEAGNTLSLLSLLHFFGLDAKLESSLLPLLFCFQDLCGRCGGIKLLLTCVLFIETHHAHATLVRQGEGGGVLLV